MKTGATPPGGAAWGKLGQAVAATRLERSWRKDDILEAYLNLVPFRGELVGLDALSRTLFWQSPAWIGWARGGHCRRPHSRPQRHGPSGWAAGLWRAAKPGRLATTPRARLCGGALRTEQVLSARLWPASSGIAPHWARRVLAQWPPGQTLPSRITTTLHADVQRVALQSLQRHLRELQGHNVEDGAVLVLDNASGQVLAWVGSSGSLSQAHEVDGVLAQRQPGSTLKPFLYAQAVQQRRLTAASLIEDSAAHINTGAGLYIPQNYDRRFKGWVSARVALASSLNVPAVRTLAMVGVEGFYQQLAQLGLGLPQPAGYYGYSLALGSSELDLLRLTNAYRALANGGRWQPIAPLVAPLAAAPHPAPSAPPAQRQAIGPQGGVYRGRDLV